MSESALSPVLMGLHIGAGCVSLIAGAAAMSFGKGSELHRKAGNWFVVAMLMMASLGAYGASREPFSPLSFLNGLLTCYLVTTAWFAAMRRQGGLLLIERLMPFIAASLLLAFVAASVVALNNTSNQYGGHSAAAFMIFGAISAIAVLGDIKMVRQKGVLEGKYRILRHLWRMMTAMLIAVASLFLGQQQVFPESLQGTVWLAIPVIFTAAYLGFWLLRMMRFPSNKQSVSNALTQAAI